MSLKVLILGFVGKNIHFMAICLLVCGMWDILAWVWCKLKAHGEPLGSMNVLILLRIFTELTQRKYLTPLHRVRTGNAVLSFHRLFILVILRQDSVKVYNQSCCHLALLSPFYVSLYTVIRLTRCNLGASQHAFNYQHLIFRFVV